MSRVPKSIEARVDRLAAPTNPEGIEQGPAPPAGAALAAWASAVCDRFADVDPAAADDDWKATVAAFRDAAAAYVEILAEIDEA